MNDILFRAVSDHVRDMVAVIDFDGRFLYANEALRNIVGNHRSQAGADFVSLIPPEEKDQLNRLLKEINNGSRSIDIETHLIGEDGSVHVVELRAIVQNEEGTTASAIVVIARDITTRKGNEKELRLLAMAVSSTKDAFCLNDLEDNILFVNPAFCETYGYREEELIGKNIGIVRSQKTSPDLLQTIQSETFKGGWNGELLNRRKDGTEFPIELWTSLVRDDFGQPIALVGVGRDISQRHQSEKQLRESSERLELTLDNLNIIAFELDAQGKFLLSRGKGLEKLGLKPDQMVGHSIYDVYRDQPLIINALKTAFTGVTQPIDVEVGGVVWHANYVPIKAPDGRVERIFGTAIDITERKRAEQLESALYRIAEQTSTSSDMENFYSSIHAIIGELMYTKNFYIALFDEESNMLSYPYFMDEFDVQPSPEPLGRTLTGFVIRTGKSLLCDEKRSEELNRLGEAELIGAPCPIWLGVPLIAEKKTIGVMVVQHYSNPRAFTTREQHILEFVSSQIAKAIEHKRAEEALRASQAELVALFASMKDVIIVLDRQGRYVKIAPTNPSRLYRSPEELLGKTVHEIFPKQEADFFLETIHRALQERTSVNIDYKLAIQERLLWFAAVISPMTEDSVVWVARDVTNQKQAEEALRESEERYRIVAETATDGIITVDESSTILFVNSATEKIFGYSVNEMLGRNLTTLMPEYLRHIHSAGSQKNRETGIKHITREAVELPGLHKNGHEIPLEVSFGEFNKHGQQIFTGIVRDITERKQAQASLLQSEEKFRTLFEESQDGVFISTPDGKPIDVNPAGVELLGYSSKEELLKMVHARDLYFSSNDRERFMTLLSNQGMVRDFEFILQRKDGQKRIMLENASVVRDEKGTITHIRGYLRDITERKKLEDQLRQAQKMEGIGTLAGGIAHDFNNLLGIILGYTTLLETAPPHSPRAEQSIETIKRAVQRGADLVRQLLTFARKSDPTFGAVNVNDMIVELGKMLSQTFPRTITLTLDLAEHLPEIIADTTQLHQALLNLCVNARDAMVDDIPGSPGKGTLTLASGLISSEHLPSKLSDVSGQQYVFITVRDTGIGMDEATRNRIFEPFFTTKELGKGTGLGLAVVYGVINSHRGYVDVESMPGVGTTFTLFFPVPINILPSTEKTTEMPRGVTKGNETVLIVEDEEMLALLLRGILEDKGYKVFTAKDGQEGLELYQQHSQEIALILSDMGLPRLGGWEMFQEMKKINHDVKAILASGYFDPNLKMDLLKAGAKDFVQKPYVAEVILQRIREVIDAE